MPEKNFISITMPDSELRKFKQWTKNLANQNDQKVYAALYNSILRIDRLAKSFAPVDLGILRSAIRPRLYREGNTLWGTVGTRIRYAPYQEFGTRPRAIIPADAKEYGIDPSDYKVSNPKRLTNVRPNPFLLPAIRIGRRDFEQKLESMGFKKK